MQLLYQTVKHALDAGRVGSPVFVRYVAQIASGREELRGVLAEALAMANSWLGASPQRVYVQGCGDAGQLTATVQYSGGQTALLSVGVAPPVYAEALRTAPQIDLMLLGNKGALYHDSTSLSLFALAAAGSVAPAEPLPISNPLMTAVEESLRTGKPTIVEEVSESE